MEESLVLCDEVLEAKPTDDGILTAMMHALRGLGRRTFSRLIFNHLVYISITDNDMVTMFEEAYKKQPTNEDLGCQTFFANVRANHWKAAHQARKSVIPITNCWLIHLTHKIATRMFKQFQDDRYLYWSVISAMLQVC